jgi:hypothetical protein
MTGLSKSAALAICFVIPLLIAWEWHWRKEGYPRTPDATKHLWAENRAKVKDLGSEDIVLVGSSRLLFDIQIYEWEKVTGRRPVQLSIPGATPMPVFQDIAEKTAFNGIVVVGVT